MKPLLIVDGYNVIGAWQLAEQKRWSIEESREQLADRLMEYAAYHGYETYLVFDATRSDRLIRTEAREGDLHIVFTRQGETADQYIERLCDAQPRYREVRVATNDAVEQMVVMGRGAGRLPARELLREMAQAQAAQRATMDRQVARRNPLIARLPKEQQERLERMRRGHE